MFVCLCVCLSVSLSPPPCGGAVGPETVLKTPKRGGRLQNGAEGPVWGIQPSFFAFGPRGGGQINIQTKFL